VEWPTELGIQGNDKVRVTSAPQLLRGQASSPTFKPMYCGKKRYQIGIPIHQGYRVFRRTKQERKDDHQPPPPTVVIRTRTHRNLRFLVKLEKA